MVPSVKAKSFYSYFLLVVFSCFISLFSSSCTHENEAPTLKVGVIQWLGYEPFFLARTLGEYSLDTIKLVELQSSTDTLRLLREGVLDAGALTLDEVLGEIALGTELEVVLVVDISNGADVLLGRPHLKELADLKGKRVGVENNAVGAVLLNGALINAGMSASDITIVPLTADKHFSSYMSGSVDALVTFNPTSNKLMTLGAIKLFDSSKIPDQIIDVIAVRKDALLESKDNIKMLIEGYLSALSQLNESPKKATAIMAPRLGISGEEMLASYDGVLLADREKNRHLFSGMPPKLSIIVESLQNTLLDAKLLERKVDSGGLINSQFILN